MSRFRLHDDTSISEELTTMACVVIVCAFEVLEFGCAIASTSSELEAPVSCERDHHRVVFSDRRWVRRMGLHC